MPSAGPLTPVQNGIEVLDEYPVVGFAAVVAVASIAYAAITFLLDGAVNVVATAVFAVVFAAVYVGFSWYVDRRDGGGRNPTGRDPGDPDADRQN